MLSVVRAVKLNQLNQQEVTMKKLSLTIIAFAALSSAAYASFEPRDLIICVDPSCENVKTPFTSSTTTTVSPLAVGDNARALTAFELMKKRSEEEGGNKH
jgi:hypothetical protein